MERYRISVFLKRLVAAVFFIFISCSVPSAVYATGVELSPSQFTLSTHVGAKAGGELKITNPTQNVALYEISSDSFASEIVYSRKSFILNGGESTTVTWNMEGKKQGQYSFSLFVTATPLGASNQVLTASGVVVPVRLAVVQGTFIVPWTKFVYGSDVALIFVAFMTLLLVLTQAARALVRQRPKDHAPL